MTLLFENTSLWKTTLGIQNEGDSDSIPRERLRKSFLSFRDRVALLANEIHRHLPDYTVHDITHLDALWEMADIIAGKDYLLTPAEIFVLGGAILLHDLGMGLASYPRGIDELRKDESWADIVTAQINNRYNRGPTPEEIDTPPEEINRLVIEILLRNLHAKHAEELALTHWESEPGNPPQYLIEDNELRLTYGRIIGLIAHSHWWPVNKLEAEFNRTLGALPSCPNDWMVDPLKVACLLRVADASHIDSRRAPSFLRAVRKPSKYSDQHWKFQEKLQKPYLSEDGLTYSSGYAFPLSDAPSWWLCLDTLKMIDKELRSVDSLFADKRLPRFTARRVTAIESPERLVDYIPTENWLPVDASVQVSDVPRLVKSLGGDQLYGHDPTVPLRELIQNSADAIRARRQIENRANDWGEIIVRLGTDEQGEWLEVDDNGIGMSAEVLTRYLLDFGTSYWGSNLMLEEFPGLLASGLRLTGKYGIGFFSIFMLGHAVRIRTRRSDAAQNDTLILEFNTGVSSRPILRPATSTEIIRDGGTSIRVWLEVAADDKNNGLLKRVGQQLYTLEELCARVAPSLDVNLKVNMNEKDFSVINASDWEDGEGRILLSRLVKEENSEKVDRKEIESFIIKASSNLRLLKNENNEIVGRACIALSSYPRRRRESINLGGVVTVGGLRSSSLSGIVGILTGAPERAARDEGRPFVSKEILADWASDQANLIPNLYSEPEDQAECAEIIWRCRGKTKDLPIAYFRDKWVSYNLISDCKDMPDELIMIDPITTWVLERSFNGLSLLPDIIVVSHSGLGSILHGSSSMDWPPYRKIEDSENEFNHLTFLITTLGGTLLESLSKCWKCSVRDIIFASNLDKEYIYKDLIVVGNVNGVEIKESGITLKNPSFERTR